MIRDAAVRCKHCDAGVPRIKGFHFHDGDIYVSCTRVFAVWARGPYTKRPWLACVDGEVLRSLTGEERWFDSPRRAYAAACLATERIADDLSRARDGRRVGKRLPIAVEGETYGLITVLERLEPDIRGDSVPARYECRCICGAVFVVKGADVVRGRKKSCGCRSGRRSL